MASRQRGANQVSYNGAAGGYEDELCMHLLTPNECYLCNGHARRDKLEAAARREAFLRALRAGLIKFDKPREPSYSRVPRAANNQTGNRTDTNHRVFDRQHRHLLSYNDNDHYRRVR
jgi:hypothetical protein